MAGWTCPDKDLQIWDGTLRAKKFQGDGNELSGISGVSAAGSNGEIQFNNNGDFGTDGRLWWDNSDKDLAIGLTAGVDVASAALHVQGTGTKHQLMVAKNWTDTTTGYVLVNQHGT